MILGHSASLIDYKNFKFVITHMPHTSSTAPYIEDLQQYGTKLLVRVCSGHYKLGPLKVAKIALIELKYPDGTFPTKSIINRWLDIVYNHYEMYPGTAIAVHCKYGLGRSAVLVAIALMESGMLSKDVVEFIREKRRGAFNQLQREQILVYESQNRLLVAANKLVVIQPEEEEDFYDSLDFLFHL